MVGGGRELPYNPARARPAHSLLTRLRSASASGRWAPSGVGGRSARGGPGCAGPAGTSFALERTRGPRGIFRVVALGGGRWCGLRETRLPGAPPSSSASVGPEPATRAGDARPADSVTARPRCVSAGRKLGGLASPPRVLHFPLPAAESRRPARPGWGMGGGGPRRPGMWPESRPTRPGGRAHWGRWAAASPQGGAAIGRGARGAGRKAAGGGAAPL